MEWVKSGSEVTFAKLLAALFVNQTLARSHEVDITPITQC
jgi:hypothetical protein